MKKRVISCIITVMCLGSLVIGCGNGDSSEDTSKTSTEHNVEDSSVESTEEKVESTEESTEEIMETTEETTEQITEAPTFENLLVNPFEGIDEKIDVKRLVGKQYVYEGDGIGEEGHFTIYIDENGSFSYIEGTTVQTYGSGVWEIDGSVITLKETIHTNRVQDTTNHFYMKDGNLLFIKSGSTQFLNIKNVKNGAKFYGSNWSKPVFAEDPFKDIQQEIRRPDVVQKQFTYEGKGYEGVGKFVIYFYEDNTFSYLQGDFAKLVGWGTWEINGSVVTLTEEDIANENGGQLINHFHVRDGHLVFIEEGSSQFLSIKTVKNGEVFYGELYEWE